MIVTSPLSNALAQLQKNLDLQSSDIALDHPELMPTFRTAAIKSFEYAYELSVRLLRRTLAAMSDAPSEVDQLDFRSMMRLAAEKGLVDDPVSWFLFREKRNITSHSYDETQSLDVLMAMPQFVAKCRELLARVEARQHVGR